MASKSAADAIAEAERRASLDKAPEVQAPYVSASVEQAGEADRAADKAQEIINDQQSGSAFASRMERLEEMFLQQSRLLQQALSKQGFTESGLTEATQEVKPTKPPVPLDAIITIYIVEGAADHEREPVLVGVNGNFRYIPRGVYTQVTPGELENLQNAVYEGEHYEAVGDSTQGKRTTGHMTVSSPVPYRRPRFQFMVQQMPGIPHS